VNAARSMTAQPRTNRGQELGARIRSRRKECGLSIEAAAANYARIAGSALTRQGWAYWEQHGCRLEQVDAVAAVLQTNAAALLGFADDTRSATP
jgi:hypothetical protein